MPQNWNCEHCHRPLAKGELLTTIDCWVVNERLQRRMTTYFHVCDDCYASRHQWCEGIFPDACQICGAEIEPGGHFLELERNRNGEPLSHGLELDEVCRILCERCSRKTR